MKNVRPFRRRQMARMALLTCHAWLALTSAIAAPQSASSTREKAPLAFKRIVGPNFQDRIWIEKAHKVEASLNELTTRLLLNTDDITDLMHQCEEKLACPGRVLAAGAGYVKGWTGRKDTVGLMGIFPTTPTLALLHVLENHDSLTDAELALFGEGNVMPTCRAAIKVPKNNGEFDQGGWGIRSVYRLANGNALIWLEAAGGDGGYTWSLQRFVELGEMCQVSKSVDYRTQSGPEDRCHKSPSVPDSYFEILNSGQVIARPPRRSCKDFSFSGPYQAR
ncbi:MAG: hypothetical protein JF586_23740 [Burkholderiales bacterium]|nr:hypothetical protein [Burkholderiales bacterium]